MTEMTRLRRHCYSVTRVHVFRRASSTRPLINGQHDCAHAWKWKGIILNICFSESPDQKQALLRATHSLYQRKRVALHVFNVW